VVKTDGFDDTFIVDQTGFRQTILKYFRSENVAGIKGSKVKWLWLLPENSRFTNVGEEVIVILGEVGHAVGQRSWVLDLALAAARSVDPKDKTVSRPRVFGIIRRIDSAGDSVLGYCREHAVSEI